MSNITRNIAECRKCGDVIESTHRHDFVTCKCGAIFTDGGLDYIRRGAQDLNDIIDRSVAHVPFSTSLYPARAPRAGSAGSPLGGRSGTRDG